MIQEWENKHNILYKSKVGRGVGVNKPVGVFKSRPTLELLRPNSNVNDTIVLQTFVNTEGPKKMYKHYNTEY